VPDASIRDKNIIRTHIAFSAEMWYEMAMVRRSSSPPPDGAAIPQDGQVDPLRLDVAAKPKRKRRRRNRPEPAQELREWEEEADKRAHARPYPPGVMLEPAGFDEEHWTAPHNDVSLWTLQLADAFGTRSQAVIATFMGQLEALCGKSHWDDEARQWRLDENEYSAALAIVNSVKPRNEVEACYAAQMVAVHLLTMKTAARAIKHEYDTQTAAVAGKLARTFTQQLESLQSLRGKRRTTRQSIKVTKELHQHVHYHDERGGDENEGQPHEARAGTTTKRAALPGPEPGGQDVPLPSRKGKTRV